MSSTKTMEAGIWACRQLAYASLTRAKWVPHTFDHSSMRNMRGEATMATVSLRSSVESHGPYAEKILLAARITDMVPWYPDRESSGASLLAKNPGPPEKPTPSAPRMTI